MKRSSRREKPRRASPLRVTDAFRAFVVEQLQDAGDITPRAMFGGVGLYCNGVFFGIIAGDRRYFRVDDSTRDNYESCGMSPFEPYPGRTGSMRLRGSAGSPGERGRAHLVGKKSGRSGRTRPDARTDQK